MGNKIRNKFKNKKSGKKDAEGVPKEFLALGSFIVFFLVGVYYYYHDTIKENVFSSAPGMFALLASALVGLMIVTYIFMESRFYSFERFATALLLVFGTLYMFVFTPMSVPDEVTHYKAAYKYSNYMTFHFNDTNEVLNMRACDYEFMSTASTRLGADQYQLMRQNMDIFTSDTQMTPCETETITSKPLAYIPQALGLTVGRILHLGAYPTFFLGRFFNLLFFCLMIYLSIKIIPIGKAAIAVASVFPMTLHLAASFSYDTYTIAMLVYLGAYIIRCIADKDKKVTVKDVIILAVLSALAVPYKIVYIGVAAMALLIPKDRFVNKKYHLLFKAAIVGAAVLAIVASQITSIANISNGVSSGGSSDATYTLSSLTADFKETFCIFFRSFEKNLAFYIETFFGSTLGWFQVGIPMYAIYVVAVIFLISLIRREDEKYIEPRFIEKSYLALLFAGMSCLIVLSMLLDFTPDGYGFAYGVQGRYWLPMITLLIPLLRCNCISRSKRSDRTVLFSMMFVNCWILLKFFVQIMRQTS